MFERNMRIHYIVAIFYMCGGKTASRQYKYAECCLKSCVNQYHPKSCYDSTNEVGFNSCLKNCAVKLNGSWPIVNQTSQCTSDHSEDDKAVCRNEWVDYHLIRMNESSVVRQYAAVLWRPCSFRTEDLRGYGITLYEENIAGRYTHCKQVSLSLNETINISNEFVVLFEQKYLEFGKNYLVYVTGLPQKQHSIFAHSSFTSATCVELNGNRKCECGLEGYGFAPSPKVTVSGYAANITIDLLDSCFNVILYEVWIMKNSSSGTEKETWKTVNRPVEPPSFVHYPLYPSSKTPREYYFTVKYRVTSSDMFQTNSLSVTIPVVAWKPDKPIISSTNGQGIISWNCSPVAYNITQYQIEVICNPVNATAKSICSAIFVITTNCSSDRIMTIPYSLKFPGLYVARVREWRDPSYNSDAAWSEMSSFFPYFKPSTVSSKIGITIISLVSVLSVVMIVTLIILCHTCKDLFKITQMLPGSVRRATKLQSTATHVCKTVWIVWQADTTVNSCCAEVHADNIRHIASFLANHCGLSVILDQYEVADAPSLSAWMREKQDMADVVIFICPHQTICMESSLQNVIGSFLSVYNLYESALLLDDCQVKIASAVLPYSKPEVYNEAKLLLTKMPSFQLMDEIDSLYFFIQNIGKACPEGRLLINNVNSHDYMKTKEGLQIKLGFDRMQKLLVGDKVDCDVAFCPEDMPQRKLEISDIECGNL